MSGASAALTHTGAWSRSSHTEAVPQSESMAQGFDEKSVEQPASSSDTHAMESLTLAIPRISFITSFKVELRFCRFLAIDVMTNPAQTAPDIGCLVSVESYRFNGPTYPRPP